MSTIDPSPSNSSRVSTDYDVIVLGGGSPGEHCAGVLAEGGLRVALVSASSSAAGHKFSIWRGRSACRAGERDEKTTR